MPGHSQPAELADVLWADAEIDSISIDYGELKIRLRESTGRRRAITCRGYIGYQMVAFWDEVVVERGELLDKDSFMDDCTRTLEATHGKELPETGDPKRNQRSWKALLVHLADGAILRVVAAEFSSEVLSVEGATL